MGYFSNGSEGDAYRMRWCERCSNDGDDTDAIGCAVWDAHLMHSYLQAGDAKRILSILIPRGVNGQNMQCQMFREKKA